MPTLLVERHVYDPSVLKAWTLRKRNALVFPARFADFARAMKRKVRGRSRKTRRFFGEAYVARKAKPRELYYSSSKWLTNPAFVSNREPKDENHEQIRRALHKHFGAHRLITLQRAVARLSRTSRKQLAGKAPSAPDVWLVDRGGCHRFIEVKLPGDSIAPHQLAGMAAIGCVLGRGNKVSVEVIHLHDDYRAFRRFCGALRAR